MAKKISLGDQAAEICIQIQQAVESWWLYDGLATYVVVRNNREKAKGFSRAYLAIWVAAFDTVVVCSYNLTVTQKNGNPLTLETFADELDAAGEDKFLVERLRAMQIKHRQFIDSLTRIRNKSTAHVDRSMKTSDQFRAAKLATADIRNFLQDLVYIFHAIAPFSSQNIGAPDIRVRDEMMQMLHLAIRSTEKMQAEHQSVLSKLHE